MDITSYFEYDETAPSCLRWAVGASGEGRGSAERKDGSAAGYKSGQGWQVQVTEGKERYRTTASRLIWEMHGNKIPDKHYIASLNGDLYDTRISNLVCVDHTGLQYLKIWRRNGAYVRESKYGKFHTSISIDKAKHYLGTYNTYEEAFTVYREALKQQLILRGIPL